MNTDFENMGFEELLADWKICHRQRQCTKAHIYQTRVRAAGLENHDLKEMLYEQATDMEENDLDQILTSIEELNNAMRDVDEEPDTMYGGPTNMPMGTL